MTDDNANNNDTISYEQSLYNGTIRSDVMGKRVSFTSHSLDDNAKSYIPYSRNQNIKSNIMKDKASYKYKPAKDYRMKK